MTASLRPVDLGEILDRTFQIYRAHFLKFLGIAAIPAFAMLGINAADYFWLHLHSFFGHSRQSAPLWNAAIWFAYFHIGAFLALVISAAQVRLASAASLDESTSMLASFRMSPKQWGRCFFTSALKFIAEVVIPEILFVLLLFFSAFVVYLAGHSGLDAVTYVFVLGPPTVAAFALFLWLRSGLSLAIPACVIEEKSGFGAIRRSWSLSKESRARIMVVWAMVIACTWLMEIGAQRTFSWAFYSLVPRPPLGSETTGVVLAVSYLLYAINSALIDPIYPIASTLFYYDQRIRREGYDIERMMESVGLTAPIIPPPGPGITVPEETAEARP